MRVLALPASPSDLGHVATIAADGLATLLPRLARFRWRELMRRSLLMSCPTAGRSDFALPLLAHPGEAPAR